MAKTGALYALHTLLGMILPCVIAWHAEYKARYASLREVANARPARLPPVTLLDRLGTVWMLPVFLLQAMHNLMFICQSMLRTGYAWASIYLLMLAWSGAIIVYNYYMYVLA